MTNRRSSNVDLAALAATMSASAKDVFSDRTAAHQSARFVRRMRKRAKLTQEQLASTIGSTQEHISTVERAAGAQGPTISMLEKIAEACGEHLLITTEEEQSERSGPVTVELPGEPSKLVVENVEVVTQSRIFTQSRKGRTNMFSGRTKIFSRVKVQTTPTGEIEKIFLLDPRSDALTERARFRSNKARPISRKLKNEI